MFDLRDLEVIVFGGGEVGLRKAEYLAAEATVTVVSRDFHPRFRCGRFRLIEEEAGKRPAYWISHADLVVAALDDSRLNDMIENLSRQAGRPCNRADGTGTFLIPSVVQRRNYVIAVSTLGRSPAVSRYLRMRLEEELGPEVEAMIDLQERVRAEIRPMVDDQKHREKILRGLVADQQIWELLRTDKGKALDEALRRAGEASGDTT